MVSLSKHNGELDSLHTPETSSEICGSGGVYAPPQPRGPAFFSGGGNRLGSDEIESQFIPDPNASEEPEEGEYSRHFVLLIGADDE